MTQETVDPFEIETATVVPINPANTLQLIHRGLKLPAGAKVVQLTPPGQNGQQLIFISGLPIGSRFVANPAGQLEYEQPPAGPTPAKTDS